MNKLLFRSMAPVALLTPDLAIAEDTLNSGDTAWMITATALVLLMTLPGLALFYGGMVRKKNVLSVGMQTITIAALMSVLWVVAGYSLAFGEGGAYVGDLSKAFFAGISVDTLSGTIPESVFATFQMTFAIITPVLIIGAFAERMKFSAVLLFMSIWMLVVYAPICHMVWGGGFLGETGALDFAGGTVVHISSGTSALVVALVIGKRKGFPRTSMPPHNLPMTVLGTALLWFGWFGFNSGSALAADGIAALALVTTNTAAAAGGLAWVFIEWGTRGKPTVLGAVSGAVAGLVAITPGAGFVGPVSAIIIGLVGGALCFCTVSYLKPAFGYDDSLDVFGIHGIGGIWGALATGLFASVGAKGAFFGDMHQFLVQIIAVAATIVFAMSLTFIILMVVKAIVGLRVTEEDEVMGLDLSEHGEAGYTR